MPTPVRRVRRREPVRVAPQSDAEETPIIPADHVKEENTAGLTEISTPRKRKASELLEEAPFTPPGTPSAFLLGKALFQRGSQTRQVIGRLDEKQKVLEFLVPRLANHTGGALYLSGLPGTGKTALLTEILGELDVETALINCMILDKPDQVFGLISKEFGLSDRRSNPSREHAIAELNKIFFSNDRSHVLVLDELDHLMTADQEVLFKLFEWACQAGSNFVIVGIANAIDLTDRFLPRLQAHKLTPQVVPFTPYSANDIAEIIQSRLQTLRPDDDEIPLMHAAAVRICAAKTAANSGDLRKAFDICRRCIELVEEDAIRSGKSFSEFDVHLAPKVTVQTVARVCVEAFGGVSPAKRAKTLNLQQKAVLCMVVMSEREIAGQQANLTVNQVFANYSAKCRENKTFTPLRFPEFLQVIAALESSGLANVTGMCHKKGLGTTERARKSRGGGGASNARGTEGYREEYGLRRISSRVPLMDIVTALSDADPLRDMFLNTL